MRVVTNSSPLIVLCKSGLADLLPQVCDEVLVPEAVWDEVILGSNDDEAARILPLAVWAKRTAVVTDDPLIRAWNLGAGETAVLNLALSLPGYRALIDDGAARACAKTLHIPFLGAGGLLVLAKRRGLIASVDEALQKVIDVGLWLSGDVVKLLKQQAGE
jgi:predicted nucleic acid-binding protein